jgi:uncharacterized protein (UPF0276 family)
MGWHLLPQGGKRMGGEMLRELPFLGAGLGFRQDLKADILENLERIDFLELMIEQYMDMPPHKESEARILAKCVPLVIHGVELSIGTSASVDQSHMNKMKRVAEFSDAYWISDHLCFTRVQDHAVGNLTPVAFTEDNCLNIIHKIKTIQCQFDRPFLLENISYYFEVPPREMTEAAFINCIMLEADCYMLLDLTNVQNNARNIGYDAFEFVNQLPLERVVQIHLAGGIFHRGLLLDTHSHPVPDDVFALLAHFLPAMPNLRGVLIERDQNFPPFDELLEELDHIRALLREHWAVHFIHKVSASPDWMHVRQNSDGDRPNLHHMVG